MDMSNIDQVAFPQIAYERMNRLESRTARIGAIALGYAGLLPLLLLSEAVSKLGVSASIALKQATRKA